MPYPGVPDSLTSKVETCVEKVMKQGHDKSSAIAICHASIVGTKDTEATSSNATYAFGSGGLLNTPGLGSRAKRKKAKVIPAAILHTAKEIATLIKTKASYPWDQCVADQMKRYGSRDTAEKVCGAIRAGKERIEIEAELGLNQSLRDPERSTFTVFKDARGAYRWVSISSNSYLDNDGEIVSQKALEEDCARADATGDYGPLRWWHVGDFTNGIDIGNCDFNAMQGRLLIESGTFKDEYIGRCVATKAENTRMSIGFTHTRQEPDSEGVYHHVKRFERSLLPREKAANSFTAIAVHKELDDMATMEEKWKEFVALVGDEQKAKEYVTAFNGTQKQIDDAGVKHKESGATSGVLTINGTNAYGTPGSGISATVTTKAMPAALAAAEAKPGDKPAESKAAGDTGAAPGDLWGEGSPQEESSEPPTEAAAEGDTGASGASIADMTVGELQQALAQMLASMILQSTKELSDRIVVLETAQTTRTKELDDSAKRIKDLHRRVKELEGDAPRQPGFRASTQGQPPREALTKKEAQPYQDPLVGHMLEGIQQVMGGQ